MDIKTLAFILLIGRLISITFILIVIRRQWRLRKTRTHPKLKAYRKVLAFLALVILVGNIYPFVLDALTILAPFPIDRPHTVSAVSVAYTLDNNLTFVVASALIWTLYKLADTVIEIAELVTNDSQTA